MSKDYEGANAEVVTRVVEAVEAKLGPRLENIEKVGAELKEKSLQLKAPVPWATSGPVGGDSEPYSVAKMAAVAMGFASPETAKYECDVSEKLKGLYSNFKFHRAPSRDAWLVPAVSADVAHYARLKSDKDGSWGHEVAVRMKGWGNQYDPDEARWHLQKGNIREKTLNTLADTQGGVLRGFPTLGDIIDFQRNLEVFTRAGATEISLPPNGMLSFPKQVGATTAYYLGEARTPPSTSETKYGVLDLQAKKLIIRTELTNDLLRFVTPSVETMVRNDMAQVAKRRFDKACLDDPGSQTTPRGLITYTRPTTPLTQWVEGQDYVIEYTAATVGTNGNTISPQDVYTMTSKLPDETQEADKLAWIGRFDMYAAMANRKADAVVPGDAAGPFLFNMMREVGSKQEAAINGNRFVRSSQVSNTRVKGSGTNLTYLIVGDISQWVIGRFGVLEFLATNVSDNAFDNDTTKLRAIEYHDAGPRHAAAFALCDSLLIA